MAFNSKYTGAQIESKLDSVKPVDSSLSSSSTNPVQNKVVKNALDAKADTTYVDEEFSNIEAIIDTINGTLESIGGGGISQESDPTVPQHVKEISQADISGWDAKGTYSKPSGGIPKTDLASAVQSSLDKADTAVQDVSGLATKSEVNAKQDVISDLEDIRSGAAAGATAVQDVSGLATKAEVNAKQDALNATQTAAANSGITAAKVAAYDAYAAAISGLNTQIGNINTLLDTVNGETI